MYQLQTRKRCLVKHFGPSCEKRALLSAREEGEKEEDRKRRVGVHTEKGGGQTREEVEGAGEGGSIGERRKAISQFREARG